MELSSCVLTGKSIRLEPLTFDHHKHLAATISDPEVGRWMTTPLATGADMRRFIEDALRARDSGTALPFATVDLATDQIVGSTRYLNIDLANRRVEIGATFVTPQWQRTRANTEAKYLMLRYAFGQLGCIRVELKTDALNERSRRAILRLGAKEEGTLRQHMIVTGGRVRDTVYFSIIDREWPDVKARLEAKLARQPDGETRQAERSEGSRQLPNLQS